MLNFATAQDAATTAANSFNSATREQQIFNQSLEARINRLSTAWSSFATTVGDELLYDGIVVVTSGLESLTKSGEDGAKSIGVLAPAFGVLGLAILALSPALRTLITASLPQLTVASLQASGATTVFGTSLARLGTVATVANASIRLLSFAGPLVAFAALGFAIEKVTSALADNIKQQEELDMYNQNNIDSLTKNKTQVDELLLSYRNLSAQRQSAPLSPDAEREYLDVQNKIAEVFPALISYIDSTGQAHLKTGDAIDVQIAKTKELIDVQNQVSIGDSLQAFEDLNNKLSGGFLSSGNLLYGSLQKQLAAAEEEVARLNRFDIDDSSAQLNLINIRQQIANTYDEIRGQILSTSTAVAELNGTLIDPKLNATIQAFLQNLDFSNLDNEGLQTFTYELGNITSGLQSAFNAGDTNAFSGLTQSLNELGKTTNDFKPSIASFTTTIEDLNRTSNLTTIPIDTLGLGIEDLGEGVEGAGESLNGFNAEATEFKDVVEQISGVSQSVIDSNDDLLFQYEALTARLSDYSDQELQDILNKTNLTNAERAVKDILIERGLVTGNLIAQYPTLLGQDEDAISLSYEKITAVRNENLANENLLAGYQALRDGKLNAEQSATLATAQGTKDRIGAIKNEIQALIILQKQIANTSLTNQEFADQVNSGALQPSGTSFVIPKIVEDNISTKTVELAELEELYNSTTTNIAKFVSALDTSNSSSSKASKSASDSAKSASKATKEAAYVTDKYAQAISDLNLEIEKQVNSRKTLNDFDAKYRTSLSAQIKLEERRLQLEKNQAAQLQKQISAGTGGQKVVDETKESLNRLRSEILSTTDSITTLAAELVSSNLSNFDNLRGNLDRFYSVDSSILQNTNRDTAKYNDLLDHQILILNKKQAINQQEVDYLNKQIFSGKLTSQQLSELNGRFTELTVTINDLNTEVSRLELDKLGSFQDAQEKSSRLVEYYNQVLTTLTEGTDDYNKALELSTKSTKDLIREQENELKALIYLATNARLSGEVFDDVTARTQELTLSISRLNNELLANDVNASKEALDKIYDQYVNTYKDAVNQRKEDTLRALTAERKAEDDAYKARVKRLNDELDLFRRNANERLALIDKEESDRSYEEDIDGLSSRRNDLQSDLNVRLADNSRQGVAQRAAIQEQIDAIDKEIAEKRRDRDITLQKEALQQNITDKENEINSRLEQEEEAYNYVVDRIDRQKEYYEDYYNDLLNDERKFARVREEIAKGNFDSISVEFEGFIGDLTATLPELENTFDGTWQAVGTSIRVNVIDSLKEALELLNQYNSSSFAGASFGGGSFSGNQSSGTASFNTTLSNGDKQVLLGKLLRENLVGTSAPANDPYIIQKGNAIAAKGRASGSTISAEVDLPTILSGLGRQDLQELSAYFNSQARSIVDTPSLQNLILDYAKNIASLDTGGFVNSSGSGVDGRGGKVGILHPNEIVLDKVDTKQYIAGIDILRNAMPILSSIASNFNAANVASTPGDVIDIKFLGNIYTQNQEQVNGLANTIVEGIKRRGGTFK